MLHFEGETRAVRDVCCAGADITRRGTANMAALAPRAGETLLYLGCGKGLMTRELARATVLTGKVIGVDASLDRSKEAQKRCAPFDTVRVLNNRAIARGTGCGKVSPCEV